MLYKELNKTKKNNLVQGLTFREGNSEKDDRLQMVDYVVSGHSQIIKNQKETDFKKIESKVTKLEIISYN